MNVAIVEDSELIRTMMLRIIEQYPRLNIVGVAAGEDEAVNLILNGQVDAVLLDLFLSPGSGVRVLSRIRAAGCGARVLVVTNNTSPALRHACHALGATGFYDKTSEVDDCIDHLLGWLPPLPDDEARRLQQLHSLRLLDTQEQEAFDKLTQLAADIAETPISLVSLIDEKRQWFLSHFGLETRETSRSIAFCAHAILRREMMEIPDARLDERFRDNPLVVGPPHIRFYAGFPLVLPSGEALGTLCVIDSQPRQLTERQRRALQTLAASVLVEIELRRRVIFLEQEAARRQAAEAHILQLATRDPLTALPNRATFHDRLDQHVRFALRRNTRLGVLFVDLDRFKPVNDTLGHEVGDEALVAIAERLNRCLRGSDTVARLGGDEFAVVLPDVAGEAEAMQVAAKMIAAVQEPLSARGHRVHLGASVGVAMFPEHGRVGDQLLHHADLAMYRAKEDGGGQSCLYTRELSDRVEELQALDSDLRDGLRRGELFLHFQPQVVLDTGEMCGVEALVRWRHPHFGVLSPDHFIPLAEQRGFIHDLTRQVLDMALAQIKAWDLDGLHVPRIAINVSPSEIRGNFVQTIEGALQRHGVAPHRLELEITEATLNSNGVDVLHMLEQLRQVGVSIAVDDFGVGYSSLGQLHRLPIDALKIDRSFIENIERSTAHRAIVQAIVTMAEALGLRTVAEGVEQEGQIGVLEDIGCICTQGYFLCQPAPAREAARWIRAFHASAD